VQCGGGGLGCCGFASGPAGEEVQGLLGGRVGGCRIEVDALAGVAGELEGFVVELQIADQGVVEAFAAGAVIPDVMGGPAAAKVMAAGGRG